MRRWFVLVTAVLTSFVSGAAPGGASEEPEFFKFSVVGETLFNPCTSTNVTLDKGTFQFFLHITNDGNGGFHLIAEGNARGVSGTDPAGTVYSLSGGFWGEINTKSSTQTTFTVTDVFNIVSRGSAQDFHVNAMFHLNVSETGDITNERFNLATDGLCRGRDS